MPKIAIIFGSDMNLGVLQVNFVHLSEVGTKENPLSLGIFSVSRKNIEINPF